MRSVGCHPSRRGVSATRAARRPAFAAVFASLAALGVAAVASGCGATEDSGPSKSPATVRAERRAYDGAPPTIPHEPFGMTCASCHNQRGMEVADVGFAPPSPHEATAGMSALSRCRQCHVLRRTEDELVASLFVPLRQDLRRGQRLNDLAPPTIPHKTFMRDNCAACHTGTAAREEIRTSHPERVRCRQCHVPVKTRETFVSSAMMAARRR